MDPLYREYIILPAHDDQGYDGCRVVGNDEDDADGDVWVVLGIDKDEKRWLISKHKMRDKEVFRTMMSAVDQLRAAKNRLKFVTNDALRQVYDGAYEALQYIDVRNDPTYKYTEQ